MVARGLQYSSLPRAPRVSQDSVGSTLGFSLSYEGVTMIETEATVPVAEIIVLERIEAAAADYERLQSEVVGQVVSTGDRFGGFEIIEIVPPDEPALVVEATTLEIV